MDATTKDDIEKAVVDAAESNLTMDDLTSGEKLPEVQQNAIDAVQKRLAESEVPADGVSDNDAPYGRKKDGTPKKKRGRQPSAEKPAKASTSFNFGTDAPPAADPNAPAAIDSTHAAVLASAVIEGFTVSTISKAWALDKEEKPRNIMAWKAAFDHYGGVAISPPLMLVADHLMIIQKRVLQDSETKSRIGLGIAWIKTKIKRRKRDDRTPEDVGE